MFIYIHFKLIHGSVLLTLEAVKYVSYSRCDTGKILKLDEMYMTMEVFSRPSH